MSKKFNSASILELIENDGIAKFTVKYPRWEDEYEYADGRWYHRMYEPAGNVVAEGRIDKHNVKHLAYCGISDANLENAEFRWEANIGDIDKSFEEFAARIQKGNTEIQEMSTECLKTGLKRDDVNNTLDKAQEIIENMRMFVNGLSDENYQRIVQTILQWQSAATSYVPNQPQQETVSL